MKQAPDDFFQLRLFKDFRHSPGAMRILGNLSSNHKSNGHRTTVSTEMPCALFSVKKYTVGDQPATGRRPDAARTNTCRTSCRRQATVQSKSSRLTIYVIICVQ